MGPLPSMLRSALPALLLLANFAGGAFGSHAIGEESDAVATLDKSKARACEAALRTVMNTCGEWEAWMPLMCVGTSNCNRTLGDIRDSCPSEYDLDFQGQLIPAPMWLDMVQAQCGSECDKAFATMSRNPKCSGDNFGEMLCDGECHALFSSILETCARGPPVNVVGAEFKAIYDWLAKEIPQCPPREQLTTMTTTRALARRAELVIDFFDYAAGSCAGRPSVTHRYDYGAVGSCVLYHDQWDPEWPTNGRYFRVDSCEPDKLLVSWPCNKGCTKCEWKNTRYYKDECMDNRFPNGPRFVPSWENCPASTVQACTALKKSEAEAAQAQLCSAGSFSASGS